MMMQRGGGTKNYCGIVLLDGSLQSIIVIVYCDQWFFLRGLKNHAVSSLGVLTSRLCKCFDAVLHFLCILWGSVLFLKIPHSSLGDKDHKKMIMNRLC